VEKVMDLETRVLGMEDKLGEALKALKSISDQLEAIGLGIYGDEKNRHVGLLQRQEDTNREIGEIQRRLTQIEDKNAEQDIALKAKKTLWVQVLEIVKWLGLAYLVLKGVFGFDTLFNKLF
jgi:hypothetical protein